MPRFRSRLLKSSSGPCVRSRALSPSRFQDVQRSSSCPASFSNDVHRDVPGSRVMLEAIEHGPAVNAGQIDVERDRVRPVLVRHAQTRLSIQGHQRLEVLLAGQVEQDPGEALIVFDHQHDPIAGLHRLAIIAERVGDDRFR